MPKLFAQRDADLIALFEREGYARSEPAILHSIAPFLDLSGEDIRRRMFLTTDADGREACLRPEYTIPVALDWIATGAQVPAQFSYLGPVFRMRPGESGEFVQAGVESFGRSDIAAADADALGVALEALAGLGLAHPQVTIGDVGLFRAFVGALNLPAAASRRLNRAFAQGRFDAAGIAAATTGPVSPASEAGMLAALQGADPMAARSFVEDILKIAGIATVGGRTAGEIAARFLEKADEGHAALGSEQVAALNAFAAIEADPDMAAERVRALAGTLDLDLADAIDIFEMRTGFLAARGVDPTTLHFSARFGRNLDYYTGFVFEARGAGHPDCKPVLGGGRYDHLIRLLGAPAGAPAVGFSIWLDRIDSAAQAPAQDNAI